MESNFEFLNLEYDWHELFDRTHKSEKYANSDERASLVYSRMALELIVDFIYQYESLEKPNDNLSTKTSAAVFSSMLSKDLIAKINAIRKCGNKAAHNSNVEKEPTTEIVKYLFDFSKWFFLNYSQISNGFQVEFNAKILDKYNKTKVFSEEQLLELEKRLKQENNEIISNYKTRILSLEKIVSEKDQALEKYRSIMTKMENDYNLLQQEFENQNSSFKVIEVGITEQIGKIWGRVFINLLINNQQYYAVKFFSPNHLGRSTERFVINSGTYQQSQLYNLFSSSKEHLRKNDVLDGVYDHLNLVLEYNKNRFGTPSILLTKLLNDVDNCLNSSSIISDEKTIEFARILNFSNYFTAGEVEYGIHGPEMSNSNLYLSIYHYLEYLGLRPRDYNTFSLGKSLLLKSGTDFKTCKYKNQSFYINKFNLNLLKCERTSFENHRK